MASLIRTRLSDLCTRREVGTFGEETLVQLYPRMKTSYLGSVGPRTTDVPNPGASTLISAPRPPRKVSSECFFLGSFSLSLLVVSCKSLFLDSFSLGLLKEVSFESLFLYSFSLGLLLVVFPGSLFLGYFCLGLLVVSCRSLFLGSFGFLLKGSYENLLLCSFSLSRLL